MGEEVTHMSSGSVDTEKQQEVRIGTQGGTGRSTLYAFATLIAYISGDVEERGLGAILRQAFEKLGDNDCPLPRWENSIEEVLRTFEQLSLEKTSGGMFKQPELKFASFEGWELEIKRQPSDTWEISFRGTAEDVCKLEEARQKLPEALAKL